MGNKNLLPSKKGNINPNSLSTKKLKKKKHIKSNPISSLSKIKYKDDNLISIGFYHGGIEIYEVSNLDLVAKNYNAINELEIIKYVSYLNNNNFMVSTSHIYIFTIYKNKNFINQKKNSSELMYNIDLIQKIYQPNKNKYIKEDENTDIIYVFLFSKSFIFDRNLNRKYNIYEKIQDNEEELIVNYSLGIMVFTRKKENIIEDKDEEINFDINNYIKRWENNPYFFKRFIPSNIPHYDIIQVNYLFIATAIDNYVLFFSVEEYELVTKFEVSISDHCFKVLSMITDDLLCIGGGDELTLISIKDSEICLTSIIKQNYRITEICILPNYNILIGIQNKKEYRSYKTEEYLYQYKYYSKVNEMTQKVEHNIHQIGSELITTKDSNITMECINNSLITILENEYILLWDLYC